MHAAASSRSGGVKVGTQLATRRSLRLKAFASKRFGFPLFSPSILFLATDIM
jgi:hypothetical protein